MVVWATSLARTAVAILRAARPLRAQSSRTLASSAALRCQSSNDPHYELPKNELSALRQANDNMFDNYIISPVTGQGDSPSDPILVPSSQEDRIVGCICEKDFDSVIWFNLRKQDGTSRCECGNYFKLIDYDPLDRRIRPKYGFGFGSGYGTYYY